MRVGSFGCDLCFFGEGLHFLGTCSFLITFVLSCFDKEESFEASTSMLMEWQLLLDTASADLRNGPSGGLTSNALCLLAGSADCIGTFDEQTIFFPGESRLTGEASFFTCLIGGGGGWEASCLACLRGGGGEASLLL